MPAEIFKVIATFTDSSGLPLTGTQYTVHLLDEDKYFDDKLGVARLSPQGEAEFLIYTADIVSFDSRHERTPDLYFVLRREGDEIFRSEVFRDVEFDKNDPVTGRPKSLTRSFGPFRVKLG